ncbi:MAG: hypothetical protein HY719_08075 [Planctomycetes bacterium]|nr:hypothetical protein [Planctomycetota bacterium]
MVASSIERRAVSRGGVLSRLFTHNLRLKFLSLFLAVAGWYYARVISETKEVVHLGIEVALPEGENMVAVRSYTPRTARVVVSGPKAQVRKYVESINRDSDRLSVRVNRGLLTAGTEGPVAVPLERDQLYYPHQAQAPPAVKLTVEEREVTVALDRTDTVDLAVDDRNVEFLPAPDLEIVTRSVEPRQVKVTGPAGLVRQLRDTGQRAIVETYHGGALQETRIQRFQLVPLENLKFSPGVVTMNVVVRAIAEGDPIITLPDPLRTTAPRPEGPIRLLRSVDRPRERSYRVEVRPGRVEVAISGPRSAVERLAQTGFSLVVDTDRLFDDLLLDKDLRRRWEEEKSMVRAVQPGDVALHSEGQVVAGGITLKAMHPSVQITFRAP